MRHLTGSTVLFNWPLAYHDHLSRLTLVNLRCEIKNSLHCLGLVNAGIFYAIVFAAPPKLPNGALTYQGISPKTQLPERQVLAADRSWSYRFRATNSFVYHQFHCRRQRINESSFLDKADHLICQCFVWKYKIQYSSPQTILSIQHLNLSKY